MEHRSLFGAIHTTRDGDLLFAVTTGDGQRVDVDELGAHASDLLWNAIVTAVTAQARS